MTDLTPREPKRPLFWSDAILDLQDRLLDDPVTIYAVGGAVRDAYLHRPIKDLDLATPDGAISLARRIARALDADIFVLDAERDVARVLWETPDGKLVIDVARFRQPTLLEDLQDRDFTLNALAVDFKGDLALLIDPLDGETDLLAKRIRRCAPLAIAKDPIRALRAVRQSAQLKFRVDAETLTEMRTYGVRLSETSPERVRDELFKVLELPKPGGALRVAAHLGLLAVIMPTLMTRFATNDSEHDWEAALLLLDKLYAMLATISVTRTDNTAANFELGVMVVQVDRHRAKLNEQLALQWANDRSHRALLILAGLLTIAAPGDAALAEAQADGLRLSNAEKQRLAQIVQHSDHPSLTAAYSPLSAHRFWYTLEEVGVDVLLLTLARYLSHHHLYLVQRAWLTQIEHTGALLNAYYDQHAALVSPPPLLDGNQLQEALAIKPGPVIGKLLTHLREAQVEGRIHTAEEALAAAQAYLAAPPA
ncbi:MAG: CCA tRNA nucleotidyltransferase [Armatimonadetes bacterium]|nr:CCA tRNA nucleotidyltransferase [Anaerolineae bacterium]